MRKGFVAFAAGYLLATPLTLGVLVATAICGGWIGFGIAVVLLRH